MKRSEKLKLLFCITLFVTSCAPSRFVKPLDKGQKALTASFGGPTILFSGAPIPMPFTTITYAQGLTANTTAFGSLHFTSGLFGNLQSDLGASYRIYEKPLSYGFSTSPALQIAYSVGHTGSFRVWPTLDLNFYCHPFKNASYAYAGANAWFEFSKYKAHGEIQQRHVLPNLQMGYVFVKTRWQHQIEVKFLGLGIPNTPTVVSYIGLGGKGSFGVYYTLIRTF